VGVIYHIQVNPPPHRTGGGGGGRAPGQETPPPGGGGGGLDLSARFTSWIEPLSLVHTSRELERR